MNSSFFYDKYLFTLPLTLQSLSSHDAQNFHVLLFFVPFSPTTMLLKYIQIWFSYSLFSLPFWEIIKEKYLKIFPNELFREPEP